MSKKTQRRPAHKQPAHKQTEAESADKYYQAGLICADHEDYVGVVQQMTHAIQLSPELGRAYFQRGLALYVLGQVPQAINDLADSIDLNSSTIASFMELGEMAGEEIMVRMAGPLLEEIFEACYEAALIFRDVGEYKRALMALNQAAEIFSDEPDIYTERAATYYEMENYAKAVADYNRALRLDADQASVLFRRGMTFRAMNEFEKALADFAATEKIAPELPQIYTERGVVYVAQNRLDEALAEFEKGVALDDENMGVPLMMKTLALAQLGRTPEALENWNVVIVLNPLFAPPDATEALTELGKLYAPMKPAIERLIEMLGTAIQGDDREDGEG